MVFGAGGGGQCSELLSCDQAFIRQGVSCRRRWRPFPSRLAGVVENLVTRIMRACNRGFLLDVAY
uniref:Uncharacterized protein n=1 Tax=Arundo donax TaxID=35708 RepID=A0A0A9FFH8_ARUDO